jgi:hypothetical protein
MKNADAAEKGGWLKELGMKEALVIGSIVLSVVLQWAQTQFTLTTLTEKFSGMSRDVQELKDDIKTELKAAGDERRALDTRLVRIETKLADGVQR